MNTHALAAEIVTKVRNSMQDSTLNQQLVVERLIREAMDADRAAMMRKVQVRATYLTCPQTTHPQTIPDPDWPPKSPGIHC